MPGVLVSSELVWNLGVSFFLVNAASKWTQDNEEPGKGSAQELSSCNSSSNPLGIYLMFPQAVAKCSLRFVCLLYNMSACVPPPACPFHPLGLSA